MCNILSLKQRMVELVSTLFVCVCVCVCVCVLCVHTCMCVCVTTSNVITLQTGREIPPLRENERMAKVYVGEGNFKVCTLHACTLYIILTIVMD